MVGFDATHGDHMAGIYKRGDVWWGRVQRGGQEHRRSLKTRSQKVARERLGAWVEELEALAFGERPRVTFNDAADAFIKEHLPNIRPSSAKRYSSSLLFLDESMGDVLLAAIGSAEMVAFETWRRSNGAAAPTVRRDLACLSSLMSFAIEREWIDVNPVGAFLKRAKRRGLRESEARTRYLRRDEEVKLLTKCVPHVRAAVTFAIYSGLRQGEQFGLTWKEVDLKRGTVELTDERTKGRKSRTVALLPEAIEILKSLPRHIREPFVFWHDRGQRFLHMDRGLAGAARRAKIVNLRWHDLRRTHGCRLLQDLGWSIEMVRDQLGHGDVKVTQKAYAFLEAETRIERAEKRAEAKPAPSGAAKSAVARPAKKRKVNRR